MKRFTTWLLLTIFVYSIVGLHILGLQLLDVLQETWHERLAEEELITLLFDSEENICWVKKGEVILNGVLYDIEKTEIVDGKTILYARADFEEQHVIQTVAGLNKDSGKDKRISIDILSLKFRTSNQSFNFFNSVVSDIYFQKENQTLPSLFLKVASPPPRIS